VSELDQGLDLRFYLGVLRRRWLVMLVAFAVLAGGALAVAVLLPPVFESKARIIVESQQIPPDLVRSTVTGLANERLQVIRQRITTRKALLGLAEKFQPYAENGQQRSPSEMVELMRNSIAIEQFDLGQFGRRARGDSLTIGFTVGFQHRRPEIAARVANELVTLILAEDVKSRTARASETTRFLEREVQRRTRELAALEAQLAALKLENDRALPEKLPSLMNQLQRARSQFEALDRDIFGSHEQERLMELELRVRMAGLSGDAGAGGGSSLAALNAELAQKLSVYTESHPDVRALKRRIAALQSQAPAVDAPATMDDANPADADLAVLDLNTMVLQERIGALQRRRARLETQRDDVSRVMDELEELIAQVPEVQAILGNIESEHAAVRRNLEGLNSKLNEARLGERLEQDKQAERFEVIEQPVTPTEPIKPNRPMILMGGLGLAGAVALGIVVLLEMLNRTVRSTADVARILGQPPLVSIPYIITAGDRRRHRARVILGLLSFTIIIAAALLAIHFAYLPLDEVTFKVLRRFGL
jgi:polysaccharide biosynthesis transport protein